MSLEELARTDCGKKVFDKMTPELKEAFVDLEKQGASFKAPPNTGTVPSKFWDTAFEIYISKILSGPATQVANIAGLTTNTLLRFPETAAAVATSQFARAPQERLHTTEMEAEFQGFAEGVGQALDFLSLRFSKKNWSKPNLEIIPLMNKPVPEILVTNTKLENFHRAITAKNYGVVDDFILGNMVNYIGTLVNVPGNMLTSADLLSKMINFQATIAKKAARQARAETDIDGVIQPEAYRQRYEQLKFWAENDSDDYIGKAGVLDAEERSFTNRPHSQISKDIVDMKYPGARWVIPLKRAIINAVGFAIERTPIALGQTLFPGTVSPTAQMLRSPNSAERNDAWGRVATGAGVMTAAAGLWDYLDGDAPRDSQRRAEYESNGHRAFTLRTPAGNVPFRYFGQFELWLKAFAIMKQHFNAVDEDTAEDDKHIALEVTQAFVFATADAASEGLWMEDAMRSIKEMYNMIEKQSFDPGKKRLGKILGTMAVGNLGINVTRALDPGVKQTEGVFDTIIARLPLLSRSVPNRVDVWGNDVTYDANPDYLDPKLGVDPMYKKWEEIGFKIPKTSRDRGAVKMTPQEFRQFQIYAGKGDGRPQDSLRFKAEKLMSSRGWQSYTYAQGQVKELRALFQQQRDQAAELLKRDDRFDYGQRVRAQEVYKMELQRRNPR